MNATDAMRARQKARIREIPDAPVSSGALRSVHLACRKFLEQRRIRTGIQVTKRQEPTGSQALKILEIPRNRLAAAR
jgi:hypothetical protein